MIKVQKTFERNCLHYIPEYCQYENMQIKGKIQSKKLNVGQTLTFSMCSALFLLRNKSMEAAKFPCFFICLLISHDSKCTMHGRVRLEVEGIQEASVLFTLSFI